MFDEERKVANKAPVDGISVKNLNENSNDKDIKKNKIPSVILLRLLIFILEILLN